MLRSSTVLEPRCLPPSEVDFTEGASSASRLGTGPSMHKHLINHGGRIRGRGADRTGSMRIRKVPSGTGTFVKALEHVVCVEEAR